MRVGNRSAVRDGAVLANIASRWARDASGATAVEFALVVGPFLLLLTGIMAVGLQFFTIHSLEHGVTAAARKLKTGEAQKAGQTFADFRQLVCTEAGSLIPCDDKLVVHVKSGATFADLDPPVSCLTNGKLTPSGGNTGGPVSSYSGGASATVVVTACYDWELGSSLWQTIWNIVASNQAAPKQAGKTIVSSTIAFRSEPYQ
jgi:Flp pilus assembly protein TadG